MTKVTGDLARDFANYTEQQQRELLTKLQRYIERGRWAADVLQQIQAQGGAIK